jgi:hypothetical protein
MSYQRDREWSDRFIPHIKKIVGPLLLEEAPVDLDRTQATDLIVFRARDLRIAARIRRPGFFPQFGAEFTLRCARDNGVKTELAKVIEGWGDWFLYGHSDSAEACVEHWMTVDLSAFRAALIRANMNGDTRLVYDTKPNGDGTSFRAFDVRSFNWCDPPVLVSASPSVLALVNAPPRRLGEIANEILDGLRDKQGGHA